MDLDIADGEFGSSLGPSGCGKSTFLRIVIGLLMAPAGEIKRRGTGKGREDAMVFHAGTHQRDGAIVSSGGRVLCVTALADSVKAAQQRAYEVAEQVRFDGAQFRRDIGHRALRNPG